MPTPASRGSDPIGSVRSSAPGAEASLREILERLTTLEERMAAVEKAFPWIREETASGAAAELAAGKPDDEAEKRLGQVGRTLLILGGAYLLRGITAAGVVQPGTGVVLGAGYGLSWLFPADRHAARGRPVSSTFFAIASCLIVFPILWEATTRFHLLSPAAAAVGLVAASVLLLALAWRRSSAPIAWLTTAASLGSALAIAWSTRDVIPSFVAAAVVGAVTWRFARSRQWVGLAEATALAVDLGAIFLAVAFFLGKGSMPLQVFALAEAGLLGIYGVAFLAGSLLGGRPGVAEALQLGVAGIVGFGAASIAAASSPATLQTLGAVALVYALGTLPGLYRVGPLTAFYSALLFVLLAVGGFLLLPRPALAWLVLAIVAGSAGLLAKERRLGEISILFLVLTTVSSGLLGDVVRSLLAKKLPGEWDATMPGWVAVVLAAAALAFLADSRARWVDQLAIWLLLAVAAGWTTHLIGGELAIEEPARLAALRTVVLSGSTYLLVWIAHRGRALASRIVHPLLVVIGVKLLFQDLPWGEPLTLFVALFAYGIVLLTVPRMLRPLRPHADSGVES